MIEEQQDNAQTIKNTDIIFECPHCTKSLAIDYRGAGLTILCSDCGKSVQVPIPDGMELRDLDSTEEEQEGIILQLRKALTECHNKLGELSTESDSVRQRRDVLERLHTRDKERVDELREEIENIYRATEQISLSVTRLRDALDSQ